MNAVAPLIPCIVSGGSGTRLWPVSRESMPKPFMRLADDQSLLQKTFLRIAGLPDVARLLTVTNRDLLFRTLDDYRAVNRSGLAQDLLLEPVGRNTAPAIAAAALHVQEHFGDQAQLLILPADHLIRDEQAFAAAVAEARGLAAQGYLVTFGITPERAETGFGYIEQGAPLGNGFRVARFVEKPDQATAQSYLDSGKYLWNAGMFCFQAATVLQELERHAPEVRFVPLHGMAPSRTPMAQPFAGAIRDAIVAAQQVEPLLYPSLGGSLPDYVFTKILGIPAFVVPYANADEANHAPNENITLACFFAGIRTGAALLSYIGQTLGANAGMTSASMAGASVAG